MPRFRAATHLPTWRKLALGTWGAPSNPAAYGFLGLDCENALAWAARAREITGERVTLTHIVGKAAAVAIASAPETNGFPSLGRLMLRTGVDIFFQVAFFDGDGGLPRAEEREARTDANLAGVKIEGVDGKSIVAIARELREKAQAIRMRAHTETVRTTKVLGRLPGPLAAAAAHLGAFLTFDLGIDLSRYGFPVDPFGSCMVTNVGLFGIEGAWAPLLPYSRTPICITLGAVQEVPAVVDGRIAPRRHVNVGVAFDHRVLDGYHAGVMAKRFQAVFTEPEKELGAPAP